jgi:iron complex transport system substrate-binding protein
MRSTVRRARLCIIYLSLLILSTPLSCQRRAREQSRDRELRLVSFSPAVTDILFDLGLGDRIVGISRYCVVPPNYKPRIVGDMLAWDSELLLSVKPSHVFFQGPQNRFAGLVDRDRAIRLVPVELETISDIIRVTRTIGDLAGRRDAAASKLALFTAKIDAVRKRVRGLERPRVLFVLDSASHGILAAGPGTFIDEFIEACGGVNAARELAGNQRWRNAELETVLALSAEVLICQVERSEPNGSERAQRQWSRYLGQSHFSLRRVQVVSDPRWSFPSTRVADLIESMARIIHPSLR